MNAQEQLAQARANVARVRAERGTDDRHDDADSGALSEDEERELRDRPC